MSDRLRGPARRICAALASVPVASWSALLGILALGVRLPLILGEHGVTPGGDSAGYLSAATSIASGDGFGGDLYRTPGYPVMIVVLDALLPGGRVANVVIFQHALAAVLVAVIVVLAARWFGRPTALLAASILALSPALPYLEHAVLTDFLYAIVVFAFAARLGHVFLRERPSLAALVSVGALAAAATYLRPSGQALILAVIPMALYATRSVRATVRAGAIVIAVFALLVAPWIVRNWAQFDRPTMSVVTGDTLFVRAFEVDELPIPTDRVSGQLAADLAATRGEVRMVTAVTLGLQEAGLTRLQTLDAQQSLAQDAILRHPFRYAVGTIEEIGKLRVDPRDANTGTDVGPHVPDPRALTQAVWDASSALSFAWWTLSLGTFAGLLVFVAPRGETRVLGAALVFTWLVLALAIAAGRGALVRYGLELAPIAIVLGSYGAVSVGRAIGNLSARARAPGSGRARGAGRAGTAGGSERGF